MQPSVYQVLSLLSSLLWIRLDAFLTIRPPKTTCFEQRSSSSSDDMLLSPLMESSLLESSPYSERVIQAVASMTRDSCPLLGVKSVGVDYGLVRTGVAATVGFNPQPLEILSDLNNTQVCQRVVEICRAEQAKQVVVGLPLHKNGTEAEQTNLTRIFAAELANLVLYELGPDCPVYMWDERYTSKEAAARAYTKNPRQNLYGTLDADAACIILENFYNDNGEGAEQVQVSEEILKKHEELRWQRLQLEEAMAQAALQERNSRLQWRKEAMERDRLLVTDNESGTDESSKKKKKRKRKK